MLSGVFQTWKFRSLLHVSTEGQQKLDPLVRRQSPYRYFVCLRIDNPPPYLEARPLQKEACGLEMHYLHRYGESFIHSLTFENIGKSEATVQIQVHTST